MIPVSIITAAISLALGGMVPLLHGLIERLLEMGVGKDFFASTIGQGFLNAIGLHKVRDSPKVLFSELSETSAKMDDIVKRIQDYTQGREQAVSKLESQLGLLSQQERDMREKIQGLKDVPLPAAEYFASLVAKGEKRSAFRDYALFFMGVVVSTVVTIILRKLGLA
jgi:hypothetical protein